MPVTGTDPAHVIVVGAGMSGVTAARRLAAEGLSTVVLERDRWVGGRLGTRVVGRTVVDHGAQFFTTRNRHFGDWVDTLLADDLVYEWCRGFGTSDGYPRWVARGGMAELARVQAHDLDVRLDTSVRAVIAGAARWQVVVDGRDETMEADAVILTAPVPQSLRILDAGGVELGHDEQEGLSAIRYDPTLALVIVLDGSPAVPPPGAVQRDVGPFSFVADNEAKGLAEQPSLTLHASAALSTTLWTESDAKAIATLLDQADEFLGDRRVLDAHLTRWEFATPRSVWTNRTATIADRPGPLLLAGDAFGGPRIEGAWLSGDAAAAAVLKRLGGATP